MLNSNEIPQTHGKDYLQGALSPNTTDLVEEVLQVEGGFTVEIKDMEFSIRRGENSSNAYFPIEIDGEPYKIIITWNTNTELTTIGQGDINPFDNRNNDSVGHLNQLSHIHIPIYAEFMLQNSNNEVYANLLALFWQQLRARIPSHHPLSLNPNK